jgi:hypothetical protein
VTEIGELIVRRTMEGAEIVRADERARIHAPLFEMLAAGELPGCRWSPSDRIATFGDALGASVQYRVGADPDPLHLCYVMTRVDG